MQHVTWVGPAAVSAGDRTSSFNVSDGCPSTQEGGATECEPESTSSSALRTVDIKRISSDEGMLSWGPSTDVSHLKDFILLKDIVPEAREELHVQQILTAVLGQDQNGHTMLSTHGHNGAGWWVIKDAPVNLRAALARQVQVRVSQAGREIMTEGHKVSRSYFILHGEVAIKQIFGKTNADSKVEQPFHLKTLGVGEAFGDLPKGPRESPKIAPTIVAKTDVLMLCIDHAKYWSLMQGQKEAEEQACRTGLLSSLYPVWGDSGDEAAQYKWQIEIRKMNQKLKLKTYQAGQTVVQQGKEVTDVYFVVSGEIHTTVDLELMEIYPGSTKKKDEKRNRKPDLLEVSGSVAEQRLATRIELSQSLSPRHLGIVKSAQITLGSKCHGDSIGDSHLWKDHPTYKYSAVAATPAEVMKVWIALRKGTCVLQYSRLLSQVAIMSIQAFKDCPSRFLAQRYKASELNGAETKDILTRLLRIEGLAGWKPAIPMEDILPEFPTKMPPWIGQQNSLVPRSQHRPATVREQDDEEEAWRENPEGMQRKLLFHAANQSMKALSSMKIRPADAPESMFSQEQVLSSVSHNLLFGGRDILRSRQWSAFTPKLPPTPHSEPYEHPRARPATASSHAPWWIRDAAPGTPFVDQVRVNGMKPVFTPRNASVSKDPYRKQQPPRKVYSGPPQPSALITVRDPNGATLEPVQQVKAISMYMAPRKAHRRRF